MLNEARVFLPLILTLPNPTRCYNLVCNFKYSRGLQSLLSKKEP